MSKENLPFHSEIWRGPGKGYGDEPKAIEYVENHNAECSYDQAATDFSIAANALLEVCERDQLANWVAPTAYLIRQTLELKLKALLEAVIEHDGSISSKPLGQHALLEIWDVSYAWLTAKGFEIDNDARLVSTLHLLQAFDSIDPTGDLFRFGKSKKRWFGKRKTSDRVGINIPVMKSDFADAEGLLDHWESVLVRRLMMDEMNWAEDPSFDPDAFPKAE